MNLPETFSLEKHEIDSMLWRRLSQHMNARLAILRASNDGNLDATDTATIRGQIKALKALLSLAEQKEHAT